MMPQSQPQNQIEEILGFYGDDLLRFLPVPIALLDSRGYIMSLNANAENLIGATSSEILGQPIGSFLADSNNWNALSHKLESESQLSKYKLELRTKENMKVAARVNIRREVNSLGATVGYILVGVPGSLDPRDAARLDMARSTEKQRELDMTKRAFSNMLSEADTSRRRIESEQMRTRATLMGLEDGVLLFDKDGKISMVNSAAERILDIKEADVLGRQFTHLSEYAKLSQLRQVLSEDLGGSKHSRKPFLGKKEFVLGDKHKKYYQISITQASSENNNFGTIIELHDITQEKIIDRMKSEFISIAAHQLRTPLTGINWSLDAALTGEAGDVNPGLKRLLQQAAETAQRMTQVINDLLNVSRLEQNKSAFNFAIIPADEPLRKAYCGLILRAKTHNVKLVIDVEEDMPRIKADGIKLQMAFYNLIDNAIKYSHPGGTVIVSAKTVLDASGIKTVLLTVKDEGIGISSEEQERIFTKFFRANNAARVQTEGSGLGLFIVRQIVDGHKGRTWFESKEGAGTIFYVSLPTMNGYVVPQPENPTEGGAQQDAQPSTSGAAETDESCW